MLTIKKGLTPLQGFIQALTDLRLKNSMLNWVLKINPLHQKIKKWLKLFRLFGESLIYIIFSFKSHQRCKISVQKEKLHSRERNVCAWQTSFLPYFFWIKLRRRFFQIIHIWNKNLNTCFNGGLERRVSRVFLIFGINVKERRSCKVVKSLNWKKESWDNAHVRINSALIVFTPCVNIERFCAIIQ